jgi:hypothetical protein
MKKKIFLIYCLCLIAFFSACTSSDTESSGYLSPGVYIFTFTDSSNSKLCTGEIIIDSVKKIFTGNYSITEIIYKDFPGLSLLHGNYSAGYNEKSKLYGFNMNPKVTDANIFISAAWSKSKLRGNWSYTTMIGVKSGGFFEAVKKD